MRILRVSLAILIAASIVVVAAYMVLPGSFLQDFENHPQQPDSKIISLAEEITGAAASSKRTNGDYYRPIPPDEKIFTVPRNLRPVVDFWKRVYTGIYSFQAFIHDSRDVTLVYAIVDLRNESSYNRHYPGSISDAAREANKRYRAHLNYLVTKKYDPGKLNGERRRLYQFMIANGGLKEFTSAEKNLRVQRGLRDTFKAGLIRSGRYLEHYREIFRRHGLPEELTLLPHLESSYQFNARSHAAAVGIWQLTKGASQRLINIHSTVDERIDPWRSAEAAARIFKYNYNKLKTWPLAITAYNQGAYGMARAVRSVGTRDIEQIINKYRGRSYGFAGRNFYCAFVAVLEVVHNYEDYFGVITLEQPLPYVQHQLTKSATLKDVAKELGVDQETLADLNPHLRRNGVSNRSRLPSGTALNLPAEQSVE